MIPEEFAQAATEALDQLGPTHLRILADCLERGDVRGALTAVPVPGYTEVAREVVAATDWEDLSWAEIAAFMRGAAAGYEQHRAGTTVESVWSGPSSHGVPVRATAQVLIGLVAEAVHELILMTYSAKPYPPLLEALTAAVGRGVAVTVVVETLQGAGSALGGAEPAMAFTSVEAIDLWHWPVARRTEQRAKMHAKLAVADRRTLLVSSANLTQAGVAKNIEAGLLIRGGTAPRRAAEHVTELRTTGVLERLR